jgi:hypothetical protein
MVFGGGGCGLAFGRSVVSYFDNAFLTRRRHIAGPEQGRAMVAFIGFGRDLRRLGLRTVRDRLSDILSRYPWRNIL